MAQHLLPFIVPALIAGLFGCGSALLTSRLLAANERKKFERELSSKLAEWERNFAMQYAQLVASNPRQAEAVRQQFAGAYLLLSDHSERIFIPRSTRVIVGRGSNAQIVIDDLTMSKAHASIESSGDGFWLTDLDSANGTFLNGSALHGRSSLSDGDAVKFGATEATFRILGMTTANPKPV